MRSLFPESLFTRLLLSVLGLVSAAMLLVISAAFYLLPGNALTPDIVLIFLGMDILSLALVAIDIYFFARYATQPLVELARATRAVAQGQLDAPLEIRRRDEIGSLADDFRGMQRELIASRRALEEEKARYVELNELKERLLANVPHEVKTPLTAIAASLEILRTDDGQLAPEERMQLQESLVQAVTRLQFLIENMLDAASIQAGRFRLDPQVTTLAPVVEEARLFVQPLLLQRSQELSVFDTLGELHVIADPARIAQVLTNLLSNASKYGEVGGSISIRMDSDQERVRITVHSVGSPVPPEEQRRLFEPFGYSESGSGLGLSIARTIVEMHGGQIGFASDGNGETDVWFTLPCT